MVGVGGDEGIHAIFLHQRDGPGLVQQHFSDLLEKSL